MRRHMAKVALATGAVILSVAPPAGAAETLFTFEDVAAGATVSTQYAARGVTFGPSPPNVVRQQTASRPVVEVQSGTRIGRVSRACFTAECVGTAETWAQLAAGQARASVAVGAFGTAENTISLTGFDAAGNQVQTASATVTGGTGFRTVLSLSAPTASIRFLRVRGSTIGPVGIDNLRLDDAPATGAELSISTSAEPVVVRPGQTVNVPVRLTRRNSSGTIRVAGAGGFPPETRLGPAEHTLATPSALASFATLNLPLTATPRAGLATSTATITATPLSKSAGLGARSVTVAVRVQVVYDIRATAVEVTQGIQRPVFGTPTGAFQHRYTGVPLQYNGRTVVRVYANNGFGAANVNFVTARLHGFRADGTPLPGSPIFADSGSRTLTPSAVAGPTAAERLDPHGAFTFTLPPSWTGLGRPGPGHEFSPAFFATRLRAELLPPSTSPLFQECVATSCVVNNSLTLTDVGYTPTCCVEVGTAIVTASGGTTPRSIHQILREATNVTPLELNLRPYERTIDLTGDLERNDAGDLVINRDRAVTELVAFMQRDPGREIVIGVLSEEFSDGSGAFPWGLFDDLADRPYTSSAHEFQHALGREHASTACDANETGEPWPPDETGLIQGVALDRTAPVPYRIFATPPALDVRPVPLPIEEGAGDSRAFYDLMSYCTPGEGNAWISVKGWTDLIGLWRGGSHQATAAAAAARVRSAQAPPIPRLLVNATADPAGAVTIQAVRPLTPQPQPGLEPTPFRLVASDAAGAVLADVPMVGRRLEGHKAGVRRPSTFLTATAPIDAAKAHSVQVVRGGSVLASRTRSATAPTARFLSPRRGTTVGRGEKVGIRWRAADDDGGQPEVTVEWSARGGKPGTWRTVFIGPNGGRVRLPSDYFEGSRDAFLRLRANDGFNETVVVSPPFRTVHRRPTVQITSPARGARVRRDAPLSLTAEAFDERRRPLVGRALRWFRGGRLLGRGDLTLMRLPSGRHRLRVEATDGAGRRATATVRVRVVRVAPAFTTLRAPARIAARARRVRLRLASTLPARLTVRGAGVRPARARVDPRARVVSVRVRRGATPLALRLTLRADGRAARGVVEVSR